MDKSKKRGAVPGVRGGDPATVKTTVMLEPEVMEWAKRQPGGLSHKLRTLLRADMETFQKGTEASK